MTEKETKNTKKIYVSFIKDENGNDTIYPDGLMTICGGDKSLYKRLEITNYGEVYYVYGKTSLIDNHDGTYTLFTPEEDIFEDTQKVIRERLRHMREPLLEAFDLWEKAVLRGREVDDPAIMNWYSLLLDLNEDAIMNEESYPERIKYYLGRA